MKKVTFNMWKENFEDFSKKFIELEKQGDSPAWNLHEPSMNLIKIVKLFGNVIVLQMIYKLWIPGLFTCKEIQRALKIDIKYVKDMVKYLEELEIVEMMTRGVYARGPNGNLAMNLFAWIVINKEK